MIATREVTLSELRCDEMGAEVGRGGSCTNSSKQLIRGCASDSCKDCRDLQMKFIKHLPLRIPCEGDGDVVGVVNPLVRGGAQVLHGDQVVGAQEREEKGEDGEGQIEIEDERGELKERRTCTWMT